MPATADLLRRPYRPVRHVVAGADSPWPGVLSWLSTGEARLLVDTRDLPSEWPGWSHAGDGHIAAVTDVTRTDDGHAAVLPVCVERVTAFLDRRARARVPLTAGEAVTVGVCLVRARAQLSDDRDAVGEWWLTDAGRPIFAATPTGTPFAEASADVIAAAASLAPAATPWRAVGDLLHHPRVSAQEIDDAEEDFFSFAEPARLATVTPSPRRGGLDSHGHLAHDVGFANDAASENTESPETPRGRDVADVGARTPVSTALLRHVDADLADLFSRAGTDVWRRVRRLRMPRHAPVLLGALLVAVILTGGLLWPAGDESAGDDSTGAVAPSATPGPSASTSAVATSSDSSAAPAAADEQSFEKIVQDLLDRRLACTESDCLGEVLIDPSMPVPDGPATLGSGSREVTLLDDLGGVVVLRVGSTAGDATQVVVIERRNDSWLVRDVGDVTHQP